MHSGIAGKLVLGFWVCYFPVVEFIATGNPEHGAATFGSLYVAAILGWREGNRRFPR